MAGPRRPPTLRPPDRRSPAVRHALATATAWPRGWWARQSLRARITLLATALFSFAVITGAVLLLFLQRYSLTRILDQSALRSARDIATLVSSGHVPVPVVPNTGGIAAVQVLDAADNVISSSPGVDRTKSFLTPVQLDQVRHGARLEIVSPANGVPLRAVARNAGSRTVVAFSDLGRIDDSQRVLTEAAVIGSPLAVLAFALATYGVVALTLRSVAALRHGATAITAAGLAQQRLPVPRAQDEIHRLAVTLNAMLDRIDSATRRQRTFVGDAAHELRSPLASLRVQLEVAQRVGPQVDWDGLIDDVLVDVDRLDRLVEDLLTLARLDELAATRQREHVPLEQLAATVVAGYVHARVAVVARTQPVTVDGDPDALRRVAVNLINNAVRYATGTVLVDVRPGVRQDRPVAVLTVEDDGPGIPEAERQRVFDRFYRVQESRSRETGGTGLGLPIVRDIVRKHGGRVQLAARADGAPGLRAIVVLPAAGAPPVPTV